MNIFKYYRFLLALVVLAIAHQAYAYTSNDYYKAGLNLYSSQNYGQAIKYFSAALSLDTNNTSALQARANCYYVLGQYQQALADYRQVQALNPSDQLAQFIIKVQDKANASPSLAAPQMGNSYFDQGVALFQQKQYAGSVPLFQQACQEDPGNYKPYYYLGIAEVMLGDNKNGAVALGICNLKHPDTSIAAYVNRLKAGLSLDDQQWVDSQLSASPSQPVAGNSNAAPSKIFGIRLEP
ncbi:MAG TPA: tetratricopeptide repeat protein, partial [bacterium]|nr:tetratricopeptide repeat protein [bacterium]